MVRVCIQDTSPSPAFPDNPVIEMPQCPAVGEVICTDDQCVTIKTVLWTPGFANYDVQVRCW